MPLPESTSFIVERERLRRIAELTTIASGFDTPRRLRDNATLTTIADNMYTDHNITVSNAAPPQVKEALAASVPFPKRLGNAEDYAQLALTMITNGYFNGEDVRLDGAIRMAPR